MKLKAGTFDSPQIRELIKDDKIEELMNPDEKNAWKALSPPSLIFLVTVGL